MIKNAFLLLMLSVRCYCCWVAKSSPTLCCPVDYSWYTRLLCSLDFSGKNTGMGCHFLLQGALFFFFGRNVRGPSWTRYGTLDCTGGWFFLPLNHRLLHLYKLMKLSVAFVLHPCRGAGAVPGRGVSSGGRRKGETILGPGMILSKTNLVGPAREGDLWWLWSWKIRGCRS